MPASSRKTIDIVDISEAGCLPGSGHGTTNATILGLLAAEGKSLFVPEGSFEVGSPILYTSETDIVICGESAKSELIKTWNYDDADTNLFDFTSTNGVHVNNVTFSGPSYSDNAIYDGAWGTVPAISGALLSFSTCENVEVKDCIIRGNSGHGIKAHYACIGVRAIGNTFYLNEVVWDGGLCHDMWFRGELVDGALEGKNPTDLTSDVLVTNNTCWSNNSNSVLFTGTPTKVVITDNIFIPKLYNYGTKAFTDPAIGSMRKKHAITCHYSVTYNDTGQQRDGHMVVSNNMCRGGRFAVIYCNNNDAVKFDVQEGGIKGVITGNHVVDGGFNWAAGGNEGASKQGGIVVEGFQDLVISDNVVEYTHRDASGLTPAGIHVAVYKVADAEDPLVYYPAPIIANNIVKYVEGVGIRVGGTLRRLQLHGNHIANCTENYIQSQVRTAAGLANTAGTGEWRCMLHDNVFAADSIDPGFLAFSDDTFALKMGVCDMDMVGNHFDFEHCTETGTVYLISLPTTTSFRMANNHIEGPPSADVRGVYCNGSSVAGRHPITVSNNHFVNVDYCISGSGGASALAGPCLLINNSYDNCNRDVQSTMEQFQHGTVIQHTTGVGPLFEVNSLAGAPLSGTFLAGDRYVDLATGARYRHNGTSWVAI